MSEFFGDLAPQAEKDRIWQEELAQSETTFCRVLNRYGIDVAVYEPADDSFLLGEMPG